MQPVGFAHQGVAGARGSPRRRSRSQARRTAINDDLTTIGDALEQAVASHVASDRNNSSSVGHVLTDHTNVIEEDSMLTTSPTNDGSDEIRGRRTTARWPRLQRRVS